MIKDAILPKDDRKKNTDAIDLCDLGDVVLSDVYRIVVSESPPPISRGEDAERVRQCVRG